MNASMVRNHKPGILCYSFRGADAHVFQGGFLCMRGPIQRGPLVSSNGAAAPVDDCSGVYAIDLNAFAAGLAGGSPAPQLRLAGTEVQVQWWGRDKGSSFASTLSDAIGYTVGP